MCSKIWTLESIKVGWNACPCLPALCWGLNEPMCMETLCQLPRTLQTLLLLLIIIFLFSLLSLLPPPSLLPLPLLFSSSSVICFLWQECLSDILHLQIHPHPGCSAETSTGLQPFQHFPRSTQGEPLSSFLLEHLFFSWNILLFLTLRKLAVEGILVMIWFYFFVCLS